MKTMIPVLTLLMTTLSHAAGGDLSISCESGYPRSSSPHTLKVTLNPLKGTLQFETFENGEPKESGSVSPSFGIYGGHHLTLTSSTAGHFDEFLTIDAYSEKVYRTTHGQKFKLKLSKSSIGNEGYQLEFVSASNYSDTLPGGPYQEQPILLQKGAACQVTAE